MLDYNLLRAANDFAAAHDSIEDPLKAYVQASEIVFVAGVAALFVFFAPHLRRAAVAAGVSAGVALIVAHFLAAAIGRDRPFVDHPAVHMFMSHAADPSFPSDHATGAFAIAFALVLRDRRVGIIALVLAFVLSVGRVALGVHYPSDVFAGAVLGLIAALVVWAPPIRRLIDAVADRIAVTARLPHAVAD